MAEKWGMSGEHMIAASILKGLAFENAQVSLNKRSLLR